MQEPSKGDLLRLETRFTAASTLVDAAMKEYGAILMVGDPESRERSRNDVLFAVEAMLDRQEDYVYASLLSCGVDPFSRHLGPDISF